MSFQTGDHGMRNSGIGEREQDSKIGGKPGGVTVGSFTCEAKESKGRAISWPARETWGGEEKREKGSVEKHSLGNLASAEKSRRSGQ